MTLSEYVKLVADLSREVNKECPIDFDDINVDPKRIWDLMASEVVEKYQSFDPERNKIGRAHV